MKRCPITLLRKAAVSTLCSDDGKPAPLHIAGGNARECNLARGLSAERALWQGLLHADAKGSVTEGGGNEGTRLEREAGAGSRRTRHPGRSSPPWRGREVTRGFLANPRF